MHQILSYRKTLSKLFIYMQGRVQRPLDLEGTCSYANQLLRINVHSSYTNIHLRYITQHNIIIYVQSYKNIPIEIGIKFKYIRSAVVGIQILLSVLYTDMN